MTAKLRVSLAQLNLFVGDVSGNLKKIIQSATRARDELMADLIVFPELCITSYPPEDLLFRDAFLETVARALDILKNTVKDIYILVGYPEKTPAGLRNVCSLIYNGEIITTYAKQKLPNYGVFDEVRYFIPGDAAKVIDMKGIPVGLLICEDIWHEEIVKNTIDEGAKILISLNASPFEVHKDEKRRALLQKYAKNAEIPFVYLNLVGGQDELVFDGGSMIVNEKGEVCQHLGCFKENIQAFDFHYDGKKAIIREFLPPADTTEEERIYQCLVMGLRDYVLKNGFFGALLGVSGGIDSALVLAIAVDALSKENVRAVMLPSRYTSDTSMEDGLALIKNVGVAHDVISIEPSFNAFLATLAPTFQDKKPDITEENLQARCRSNILMALSNQTGSIVLTTSNRSELAMGYGTLYGDMAGGFNVLKDIPKMLVYRLAKYRNQISPIIPERILEKAPTAELRENQKDEDSLPPYAVLDKILELYIEEEKSIEEIIAAGFSEEMVTNVSKTIARNEYKRRQGAIGVRINHKAFGRDRRYPMTARDPERQNLQQSEIDKQSNYG